MSLLLIVAYPTYLISRNRLRTIEGTNGFFIATIIIGSLILVMVTINILTLLSGVEQ